MDSERFGESTRKSTYDEDGFEVLQSYAKATSSPINLATPRARWDPEETRDEDKPMNSTTAALDDLTAPFSPNQLSTGDLFSSNSFLNSALIDEEKAKSKQLLAASLTQQEKLKQSIANFVDMVSTAPSFLGNRGDSTGSGNKTSGDHQPRHQEPQGRNLLIKATVAGFVTAFLLFLVYSVVFESFKYDQLMISQNQTLMERFRSERLLDQKDSLRDALMHRSYEEARKYFDSLKLCQDKTTMQLNEMSGLKGEILRLNLEAENKEKDYQSKISHLEQQLQSKDDRMNEIRNNAKALVRKYREGVRGILLGLLEGPGTWIGIIMGGVGVVLLGVWGRGRGGGVGCSSNGEW